MPSGSRSVGGTAIMASLPPVVGIVVIAPVMSVAAAGDGAACGGIAIRALSSVFGAEELFDCFSTGVGEIIKGGVVGLVLLSAGAGACAGATGSFGPEAISLIAFSEAEIRSDGEDMRAGGRVPGSSG